MRWTPAATANSLGEIVRHLGYSERLWLRAFFAGEAKDMSWRQHMVVVPEGWSVDEVVTFYGAETAAADTVLGDATSFDLLSASEARPSTLRWNVMHLIEDIARRVGQLEITRELLDGTTGH
jgi:hypothetical protein